PLTQVPEKWRAFGCHVREVYGHDFDALTPAMEEAQRTKGRPTCIIAHTIRRKGVTCTEGD
ncbi:MAG: transketolase, partial [candidate division NC10 bacterium]